MLSPLHKIKKEPTPKSLPNPKTEEERGRTRLRLRVRRRAREREGEKELLSAAPETQKQKKNNMDSLFFLASPLILLVHVCTWIRSLRFWVIYLFLSLLKLKFQWCLSWYSLILFPYFTCLFAKPLPHYFPWCHCVNGTVAHGFIHCWFKRLQGSF